MNKRDPDTPIRDTFEDYLTDKGKGKGAESGAYRSETERLLRKFDDWLEDDSSRSVTFDDLETRTFADFARHLVQQGYTNGTVQTYYAYVASWCGWAHGEGYIPRHYARESDAEQPLPDDTGRKPGQQQAWTPEHRDRITRFVDTRVDQAFDAFGEIEVPISERDDPTSELVRTKERARFTAVKRLRERALVYVLCYTGLRGAEFLSHPKDEREGRNGITWDDVSFEDSAVTVYRKKQGWDEASLPAPVIAPLKRYKRVLEPGEDWPVFTTLHRQKLAEWVDDNMSAAEESSKIRAFRGVKPSLLLGADYEFPPPPALQTDGARTIMERLCADANIELDDKHGYLVPHGGRRGAGEVFVRQFGFAEAARYLDNSEEQVREAYQHIEAKEQAGLATAAFAATDTSVDDGSTTSDE